MTPRQAPACRPQPLLAVLAALLLAGCVSLPQAEAPPQRYVLTPLAGGGQPTNGARIAVAKPQVPAGLASDRIAVLRGGRRLDHYAGARWSAPLPDLLQDFLASSVENRLGAAAWGPEPARYRLITAVRDFQAEYGEGASGPPTVRVTLVAVLWDRVEGEAVLRRHSTLTRRAQANRLEAVTAALEGLLRRAVGDFLETAEQRLAAQGS
ncbi:MAG TPA: ABC-type transport auxiliary lipoprotein family protein [Gammaproteobacteria bacterium]|nr:ABC-type transport auxiliary lipoprotein family protein [Gammaproteobacteria bacterium]